MPPQRGREKKRALKFEEKEDAPVFRTFVSVKRGNRRVFAGPFAKHKSAIYCVKRKEKEVGEGEMEKGEPEGILVGEKGKEIESLRKLDLCTL